MGHHDAMNTDERQGERWSATEIDDFPPPLPTKGSGTLCERRWNHELTSSTGQGLSTTDDREALPSFALKRILAISVALSPGRLRH
jgi:hypothetical protein